MRDPKLLLRMMIIIVLAAAHAAESCNMMHIGKILDTEYCAENDDEDEEEFFARMSMSDIRKTRKNRYQIRSKNK
jgi:hypothetical protein